MNGDFLPTYFIAGIDPGATIGIAIVSLSGKKIATASTNGGMNEAARIVERHGTPSLIACDVFPPPEMAQKLSSYFSCRLYCPNKEIREEEKRKLAQNENVSNNHERDAYAAAIYAYRSAANKLRQIDSLADLSGSEKEKLKHLLLKGYRIVDAFAVLREPENAAAIAEKEGKSKAVTHPLSADELRLRVSSLARENANLRIAIERLEGERGRLLERLRLLENGVRQSFLRDSELRKLRFQLQKSLERLKPKKKPATRSPIPPVQKKAESISPREDRLKNLSEEEFDLETLVAEYRRGRK